MSEYSSKETPKESHDAYERQEQYSREQDYDVEEGLDNLYAKREKRQFTFAEIKQMYAKKKNVESNSE